MIKADNKARVAQTTIGPRSTRLRCAAYVRYSSDLQRETSLEDQLRNCREYAIERDWELLPEHVYQDRELSGSGIRGREGYLRLMEVIEQHPLPFDALLLDDTSRLGRNIPDVIRAAQIIVFNGVRLVFVSQGIDSARGNVEMQLAMYAMIDAEYLRGLRHKIHSGQKGRVLAGLVTGGRCYGYRNVPIEDSSRVGKYGRARVSGVRLEIVPEEAEVVRRIFRMHASGLGYAAIAKALTADGTLPPAPASNRVRCAWSRYTIREILFRELYRGVHVWNRTEKVRDPKDGRKISRRRPHSDHIRVEVPEYRIISDAQWEAVHSRLKDINSTRKAKAQGGVSYTRSGTVYFFSGLLKCGVCGSSIVICSGGGKRGYVKYGCHGRKQSGPAVCSNARFIRQDRLETQLMEQIEVRIFEPETLDLIVTRCKAELDKRREDLESGDLLKLMRKEHAKLEAEANNLTDAIAQGGRIERLVTRLADVEERLRGLDLKIASEESRCTAVPTFTSGQIRAAVMDTMKGLRDALNTEDREQARTVLRQHIKRLVLTPVERDGGVVFEVTGEFAPNQSSDGEGIGKCRKQLVARDGIEPPTPAFSGLRSTN